MDSEADLVLTRLDVGTVGGQELEVHEFILIVDEVCCLLKCFGITQRVRGVWMMIKDERQVKYKVGQYYSIALGILGRERSG